MNREEFLQGLQKALSGAVPPAVLQENLRYYDNYIRTELQNGRTENQVMEELGDPRLIARTILDTTPGAGEGEYEEYRAYGSYVSDGSDPENHAYGTGSTGQDSRSFGGGVHYYNLNKWYWKLLGIALVIGVVMLFVMVVSGILSIVVPLLPLILIVFFVMWFVRGPRR